MKFMNFERLLAFRIVLDCDFKCENRIYWNSFGAFGEIKECINETIVHNDATKIQCE